jgi:hypothetical protein
MNLAIAAGFCSLTLDSKDHPHISWADHGTGSGSKLRYIHWDGSSWHPEVLPLNSDVIGYYTSIALDLNDRPSISFYEYRGPVGSDLKDRMRVATWNGDFWEARTVDGTMGGGKFNCLASDALGRVHLAYANVVEQAGMRYALWDGKSWKMEILEGLPEANGYVGVNSCIAIDKNSNPHVTYMDTTKRNVKYGVRQNGRWKLEVVDAVGSVAYPDRNSIVVDDQGRPYIGYFDGIASVLKVAYRQGNQWFTSVVDERGTGFTSSLDIHQGKLWVSYTDQTAGGVRVAQIDLDALRGLHDGNSPSRDGSREQTPPAGNPQGR